MKKNSFMFIGVFFALYAGAQTTTNIKFTPQNIGTDLSGNQNSKNARQLSKNFDGANGAQWAIDEEGSTAYFTCNEENIKVRYDKDGRHIITRKVYTGNRLDRYVACVAKKNLARDFVISMVTELSNEEGKIYEITLQNKLYWCVVKIAEDREGYLERLGEDQIFLKV